MSNKEETLLSLVAAETQESTFVEAESIGHGLADALEPLHGVAAVHTQALPKAAYTFGDTSGKKEEEELPQRFLARAPARVLRQYSPVDIASRSPRPSDARPEFETFFTPATQPGSGSKNTLPMERARSVKQIEAQKTTYSGIQSQGASPVEEDTSHIVPADPRAAKLLRALGKQVPQEMLVAEARAQRAKAVVEVVGQPQVTVISRYSEEASPIVDVDGEATVRQAASSEAVVDIEVPESILQIAYQSSTTSSTPASSTPEQTSEHVKKKTLK